MVDTSLFYQDVYSVVKEIPAGRVATYKQIAVLTGFPQHARLVGRALRNVPDALGLPCHRVVNGGHVYTDLMSPACNQRYL